MRGELKLREKAEASKKKRKEKGRVADAGARNYTKRGQLRRFVAIISLVYNAVPGHCFHNTLRQQLPYTAPGYQRSRCASVN